MAKKTSGRMTPEDRALWRRVAATVTPRPGRRVPEKALEQADFKALLGQSGKDAGTARLKTATAPPPAAYQTVLKTPSPLDIQQKNGTQKISRLGAALPPLASLERKAKSRLARGLIEIEGRVDLHGMTQQQAHRALRRFISHARLSGWKTVLVITGKGQRASEPDATRTFDGEREAPGILRRKVPQWLAETDLRACVVGFDTAGPSHGGSGALYVRIRKMQI